MSEATREQIQFILQLTDDPRWLEKLQSMGTEVILPKLLEISANEALTLRERGRATIALGHLQDARAADALVTLLDSEDDILRAWSAKALGKIGTNNPDVLIQLARCLTDEDAYVRQQVAATLGELKATNALESLRELASRESDEGTRRSALNAIETIERGS